MSNGFYGTGPLAVSTFVQSYMQSWKELQAQRIQIEGIKARQDAAYLTAAHRKNTLDLKKADMFNRSQQKDEDQLEKARHNRAMEELSGNKKTSSDSSDWGLTPMPPEVDAVVKTASEHWLENKDAAQLARIVGGISSLNLTPEQFQTFRRSMEVSGVPGEVLDETMTKFVVPADDWDALGKDIANKPLAQPTLSTMQNPEGGLDDSGTRLATELQSRMDAYSLLQQGYKPTPVNGKYVKFGPNEKSSWASQNQQMVADITSLKGQLREHTQRQQSLERTIAESQTKFARKQEASSKALTETPQAASGGKKLFHEVGGGTARSLGSAGGTGAQPIAQGFTFKDGAYHEKMSDGSLGPPLDGFKYNLLVRKKKKEQKRQEKLVSKANSPFGQTPQTSSTGYYY
jgi:hypothetical protein